MKLTEAGICTCQLRLNVLQVSRTGVADGDGGRGHPGTAVHIQEISWDRQLQTPNSRVLNQALPTTSVISG